MRTASPICKQAVCAVMGSPVFFALTDKRNGSAGAAGEFLSDHPRTSDRQKQSQGSPLGDSALTPREWAAVRSMCGKP